MTNSPKSRFSRALKRLESSWPFENGGGRELQRSHVRYPLGESNAARSCSLEARPSPFHTVPPSNLSLPNFNKPGLRWLMTGRLPRGEPPCSSRRPLAPHGQRLTSEMCTSIRTHALACCMSGLTCRQRMTLWACISSSASRPPRSDGAKHPRFPCSRRCRRHSRRYVALFGMHVVITRRVRNPFVGVRKTQDWNTTTNNRGA